MAGWETQIARVFGFRVFNCFQPVSNFCWCLGYRRYPQRDSLWEKNIKIRERNFSSRYQFPSSSEEDLNLTGCFNRVGLILEIGSPGTVGWREDKDDVEAVRAGRSHHWAAGAETREDGTLPSCCWLFWGAHRIWECRTMLRMGSEPMAAGRMNDQSWTTPTGQAINGKEATSAFFLPSMLWRSSQWAGLAKRQRSLGNTVSRISGPAWQKEY